MTAPLPNDAFVCFALSPPPHFCETRKTPQTHARHYSPCGNALGCPDYVVHLFSMSKSFALAGWRVGYAVYPAWASEEMVKVQDTLPTHACTASQKISLAALEGTAQTTCYTRGPLARTWVSRACALLPAGSICLPCVPTYCTIRVCRVCYDSSPHPLLLCQGRVV